MKRQVYTREFKEQAIKLSYSNGKRVSEAAKELGLPVNMLHRWRREARGESAAFTGHGNARDEELAQLMRELKQAQLERDILKKAVSFFAQMPK